MQGDSMFGTEEGLGRGLSEWRERGKGKEYCCFPRHPGILRRRKT